MHRKSQLFTAFNAARRLVRTGQLDAKRLNRALGVAQQTHGENHIARYGTTATACRCPDHRMRGVFCKGMIALALVTVAA